MNELAFVNNKQAVFSCSRCNRSKVTDVSKYIPVESEVLIKYKCRCGNANTVFLERRRFNRENTETTGVYTLYKKNEEAGKGLITISNISLKGLRFKIEGKQTLPMNAKIHVEFQLEGNRHISKKAIIKNSKDGFYGVEFRGDDSFDKIIKNYIHAKNNSSAFTRRIFM